MSIKFGLYVGKNWNGFGLLDKDDQLMLSILEKLKNHTIYFGVGASDEAPKEDDNYDLVGDCLSKITVLDISDERLEAFRKSALKEQVGDFPPKMVIRNLFESVMDDITVDTDNILWEQAGITKFERNEFFLPVMKKLIEQGFYIDLVETSEGLEFESTDCYQVISCYLQVKSEKYQEV